MNADEFARQQDEQELQESILKALEASLARPLSKDEAMLLAWGSGLSNQFYKEIRA